MGYGGFRLAGKLINASHAACLAVHGEPPPGAPYALHACDNPLCCNPSHLRWGTAADNALDKSRRDRGPHKLSSQQAMEVIALQRSGVKQMAIARLFGVSPALVSILVRGRVRQHLAVPSK